jgi:hypothetical protein
MPAVAWEKKTAQRGRRLISRSEDAYTGFKTTIPSGGIRSEMLCG